MPTAQELAMLQQYGGKDFDNIDWKGLLGVMNGNYMGSMEAGQMQYTRPDNIDPNLWNQVYGPDTHSVWGKDQYQPGDGSTYIRRLAANQDGVGQGFNRYDVAQIGADGQLMNKWQNNQATGGSWMTDHGWMVPLSIFGAGMAGLGAGGAAAGEGATGSAWAGSSMPGYEMGAASSGAGTAGSVASGAGAGAAGTGAGAAAGAAGYSIPTAEELAAGGFGSGGVGLTGAGGVGSASSVAGALGPAAYSNAGYGAAGMFDWVPQGVKDFLGSKVGGAIAGGLLSGFGGSSQSGTQTVTNKTEIDPRMAQILYGADGKSGLLNQFAQQAGTPQSAGMQQFGNTATNFLGQNAGQSLNNMQASANALMGGGFYAPQATAASVNAPSQNGVDLKNAYQDMVYGQAGNNPYLTGAIQKGINQSNNAFGNMMMDATRNLNQNVLPSIRSGAIVNGSMGSSRQGIAESNALNDYSTQIGRAMSQFGQNNTDAAVSAQAGAYDADRNRALSAMSGLGAQQYGVAQQDAQMRQQANMLNPALQMQNNELNSSNIYKGLDANMNLMNNAYGYGTNQDAYSLNKFGKVSGLLSPYTGLGGSSTSSQPLYENKASNILGGALLGSQLFK